MVKAGALQPRTHAAFLRGVMPTNCKMSELAKALERGGFTSVVTVRGSGNVLFRAEGSDLAELRAGLEAAMERHLGRVFSAHVRALDTLAALASRDPFASLDVPPGGKDAVGTIVPVQKFVAPQNTAVDLAARPRSEPGPGNEARPRTEPVPAAGIAAGQADAAARAAAASNAESAAKASAEFGAQAAAAHGAQSAAKANAEFGAQAAAAHGAQSAAKATAAQQAQSQAKATAAVQAEGMAKK